jgi:hypothetical protein
MNQILWKEDKSKNPNICYDRIAPISFALTSAGLSKVSSPHFIQSLESLSSPKGLSSKSPFDDGLQQFIEAIMQGNSGSICYNCSITEERFCSMPESSNFPYSKPIIPVIVDCIFGIIDSADESEEFTIKTSFCEIYLEKTFDLLCPLENKLNNDCSNFSTRIEVYARCEDDLNEVIKVGIKNKKIRAMKKYNRECESDAVLFITIQRILNKGFCEISNLAVVFLCKKEKALFENKTKKSSNFWMKNDEIIESLEKEFSLDNESILATTLKEFMGVNTIRLFVLNDEQIPEETQENAISEQNIMEIIEPLSKNRELSINAIRNDIDLALISLQDKTLTLRKLENYARLLNKQGIKLNYLCDCERFDSASVEHLQARFELDDVIEDIKREKNIKKNLESQISNLKIRIKASMNSIPSQINLIAKLEGFGNHKYAELTQIEAPLFKLQHSVNSLLFMYSTERKTIKRLEIKHSTVFTHVDYINCQLKCLTNTRASLSKAAVEEQLRRRLKEEKDQNNKIKAEIKKTQYEIEVLLFKQYKNLIETDNLQATGKMIMDIEASIDKARLEYFQCYRGLTALQREKIHEIERVNGSFELVTKNYSELMRQFSETEIEKLVYEKKYQRLEAKASGLIVKIQELDNKRK